MNISVSLFPKFGKKKYWYSPVASKAELIWSVYNGMVAIHAQPSLQNDDEIWDLSTRYRAIVLRNTTRARKSYVSHSSKRCGIPTKKNTTAPHARSLRMFCNDRVSAVLVSQAESVCSSEWQIGSSRSQVSIVLHKLTSISTVSNLPIGWGLLFSCSCCYHITTTFQGVVFRNP